MMDLEYLVKTVIQETPLLVSVYMIVVYIRIFPSVVIKGYAGVFCYIILVLLHCIDNWSGFAHTYFLKTSHLLLFSFFVKCVESSIVQADFKAGHLSRNQANFDLCAALSVQQKAVIESDSIEWSC